MLPYVKVFGKYYPMYSIATLLGVALAVFYLQYREKGAEVSEADLELAFLYSCVGAVLGAKLLFLITCWHSFISDLPLLPDAPHHFLQKYLYSGFVFYGGMFGAFAAVWLYCKFSHIELCHTAKILLPMFPLIHSFGRIGCFCAGCCYGLPTKTFWGITFRHSPFAPNNISLIPVQLIESFAEFVLFCFLAKQSKHNKSGIIMMGQYMVSYGILRFILEFFRGDQYRGFIGTWSISQLISIVCSLTGFLILIADRPKKTLAE